MVRSFLFLHDLYEKRLAVIRSISVLEQWNEKRFEFLIGETFVRSSLAEFIEEHSVDTVGRYFFVKVVFFSTS